MDIGFHFAESKFGDFIEIISSNTITSLSNILPTGVVVHFVVRRLIV